MLTSLSLSTFPHIRGLSHHWSMAMTAHQVGHNSWHQPIHHFWSHFKFPLIIHHTLLHYTFPLIIHHTAYLPSDHTPHCIPSLWSYITLYTFPLIIHPTVYLLSDHTPHCIPSIWSYIILYTFPLIIHHTVYPQDEFWSSQTWHYKGH